MQSKCPAAVTARPPVKYCPHSFRLTRVSAIVRMGAETPDLDVDLVAALLGRNQTLFLRSVFLLLDSATLAACLAVTPAWRAFIRAQLLGSPRIFPRVLARAWRDVAGFLPIFACKSYTKGPAFLKNAGCVPLPP